MKKSDLKKRIADGFSELAPDIFEAVMEEVREQNPVVAGTEDLREQESGFFPPGKFPKRAFSGYALSACAGLLVLCLCFFGFMGSGKSGIYMILDINPSIRVELDKACQVRNLEGLNEDGKEIAESIAWKRKEPVQELLAALLKASVEGGYLRRDSGILVTISAKDRGLGDELEQTVGKEIDLQLEALAVSGVTTVFQHVDKGDGREGRKILETELMESCGLNEEQVQGMSVQELIDYCQEHTALELTPSEGSKVQENTPDDVPEEAEKDSFMDNAGQKPGEDDRVLETADAAMREEKPEQKKDSKKEDADEGAEGTDASGKDENADKNAENSGQKDGGFGSSRQDTEDKAKKQGNQDKKDKKNKKEKNKEDHNKKDKDGSNGNKNKNKKDKAEKQNGKKDKKDKAEKQDGKKDKKDKAEKQDGKKDKKDKAEKQDGKKDKKDKAEKQDEKKDKKDKEGKDQDKQSAGSEDKTKQDQGGKDKKEKGNGKKKEE